jgi:hypothetical protein
VRHNIYKILTDRLSHSALPLHLAALAMVLLLPALWIGWQLDDHFHRFVMLCPPPFECAPLEAFSSLRGDPEVMREYVDLGLFPWWTPPGFRLAFFRYLSAVSMWIDYQLWPNLPALMHLQSLFWYAALVAVAALLYRRLLGASWCAGLAALLYAVDEAHAAPVAWLANRNALLATLFGFLCLWAFDRWRKEGSRKHAVLSPIFFGLALCSGEMALATAGYLLAYALFIDRAKWHGRLTALTAHALVLLTWAIVYRVYDFGTSGSDYYHDPLGSPIAFLGALVAHAPVLILGQWSAIPADLSVLFPEEAYPAFWLAGATVLAVAAAFLTPLIRKDPVARFWAFGMALSLIPIAAVTPSNRLLFFVGLGAMGLVAQFVRRVGEGAGWMPRVRIWRPIARGAVVLLVAVHLLVAPLLCPLLAYSVKSLGDPAVRAIASVPDDPAISEQNLILVNPPDYLLVVSPILTLKILDGKPYPKRVRTLIAGPSPVELTRLGERSLLVRAEAGVYGGPLGGLFRSRRDPMAAGQRFDLTGMEIEIVETNPHGDPVEVHYTFSVPLEDPSLRWMVWQDEEYESFAPPPIGMSIALPPSYGPADTFRR